MTNNRRLVYCLHVTKETAKLLLLEKGAEIVLQKGFNHTGIQEILNAAGIPKGSFYFHFKSKNDFGLQLIDFYANHIFALMDGFFEDKETTPVNRLRRFFDSFILHSQHSEFKGGCPIGNFAQEMGDIDESFRVKLKSVFDRLRFKIGQCLKEAQEMGEISDALDPYETADFIIDSWEGALLRMKVVKSADPLKLCIKIISTYILT